MIMRTTKVINAETGKTIYESTCTIDGNKITGCQNPFPYIKRLTRKHSLHIINMVENGQNITLFAR